MSWARSTSRSRSETFVPGVADLVGSPAAFERPQHFARRARIDPDCVRRTGRADTPEHLENLGERVGLQREPEAERDTGTGGGVLQAARVLGIPLPVVHEQRRAMQARQGLGVLANRSSVARHGTRDRAAATTRARPASRRMRGGRGLGASSGRDPLRRGPRWTRACGGRRGRPRRSRPRTPRCCGRTVRGTR